jgi:catechol 2,3-dioxygenase-like lactoylglutathione lyase family enzyme
VGTIEYGGTLVCSLNVSNLERSIAWYRDGLGFTEIYRMPEYGWCELRSPIPNVSVGLQQVDTGFGEGGATLSFTVADVAEARRHLESLGARFKGDTVVIPGDNGVKLANFLDPDGNPLTLAQPNRPVAVR